MKPEWSLTQLEFKQASGDKEFMDLWLSAVKAVCSSYNYDVVERKFTGEIQWHNWPIRLVKMMTSAKNLNQSEVLDSLIHFAKALKPEQRVGKFVDEDLLTLFSFPLQ